MQNKMKFISYIVQKYSVKHLIHLNCKQTFLTLVKMLKYRICTSISIKLTISASMKLLSGLLEEVPRLDSCPWLRKFSLMFQYGNIYEHNCKYVGIW